MQYRGSTKFSCLMQVQIGCTMNTKGLKSFETPHNFNNLLGVHEFKIDEQPKDIKVLWKKIVELVDLTNSDSTGCRSTIHGYHFETFVKLHCDKLDIDKHILVTLVTTQEVTYVCSVKAMSLILITLQNTILL